MFVTKVEFDNRVVNLCPTHSCKEDNVFTVVVGRNGSGKSTLLQKIVTIPLSSLVRENSDGQDIRDLMRSSDNQNPLDLTGAITLNDGDIVQTVLIRDYDSDLPKTDNSDGIWREEKYVVIDSFLNDRQQSHITNCPKIVAVSSSPFDKFPVFNDGFMRSAFSYRDRYQYRGGRTKTSSSFDYMTSKFNQLGSSFVEFFLNRENTARTLQPLFKLLGVKSKFKVILTMPFPISFEDILGGVDMNDLEGAINGSFFFNGSLKVKYLSQQEKILILKSAKSIYDRLLLGRENILNRRNETVFIELDDSETYERSILEDYAVLVRYNIFELLDIEFIKSKGGGKFLLTEASSGELCMLFSIVSIAGAISDNTIILVDEPEISLHPEWQRDFLPLLKSMFFLYKRCHFIVATHSPSVVSSIPQSNSFVVNLESNPAIAVRGVEYSFKSSDYQLAETFNSAGYKNEYLIRRLLEVLSRLSEGEPLDGELRQSVKALIDKNIVVDEGDPVNKLLSTLNKAWEVLNRE